MKRWLIGLAAVAAIAVGGSLIAAVPAAAAPSMTVGNVVPDLASGMVQFDVTSSEGELRACYYVDTPDDPYLSESTYATWVDTDGASHVAVLWDWTDDYTVRSGTIQMWLEPEPGITPAAITSIHAECTVRYLAGSHEQRRVRSIDKNGTQTSSRNWSALRTGGNCNYDSLRGDLLTTCLFARSVSTYGMRSQNKIVGSFVRTSPGIFPCHTSVNRDVYRNGHAIRFTLTTANANGFAQCWVENVGIRVEYFRTVKDYETVDVAADWGSTTTISAVAEGEPEAQTEGQREARAVGNVQPDPQVGASTGGGTEVPDQGGERGDRISRGLERSAYQRLGEVAETTFRLPA